MECQKQDEAKKAERRKKRAEREDEKKKAEEEKAKMAVREVFFFFFDWEKTIAIWKEEMLPRNTFYNVKISPCWIKFLSWQVQVFSLD